MMRTWLQKMRRDERGMAIVYVAMGFMAFFAASMLAIDVGQLMTARTQAQTAADAGALAGATALVFNSFTDQSASGPAVSGAISTAQSNTIIGGMPSVTPADVTFPYDATTASFDQVQVTVYRTVARGNPLATLIATYFGMPTADITATATAAAIPATTENCVLPFTIPDKWIEQQCATQTCPWAPTDSFDLFASSGNKANTGTALPNPDIYIPPGQPGATGYSPATDVGLELTLKPSNQNQVTPSFYNAWDIDGITGASAYSTNISSCNSTYTDLFQNMTPETGNMVGPTKQGTQSLVDQDPNAYWDTTCNGGSGCVKGGDPQFKISPRVRTVPLYNPILYAQDQHSGKSWPTLQIVNYIGFFIESVDGAGAVTGRITPVIGGFNKGAPIPTGGFARAIILVQ